MATFRNYEPRSEGLNAAYDLLLRAELAKAQAMGGAFAPLTDAIRSGQQMKIARDEQARLKQAQAEDSALRTQRMGLDTRELDLREKTLNRQMAQDDAFARAMAAINGPEPMQPASSGVPFQGGGSAAMTQRLPLSAGGLLGGGGGQIDPSMLGAMGGENASRYMTMQNTIADNQRADAKIAYDQQAETSEQKAYADYLKGLEKELPPELIPGYKARMLTKEGRSKGYEEIGKYMGEKGKAARENTEFETYRTNMLKEWKKAYGADPKKMGEVADIETWSKGLPGTPEEKRKAWDSRAEKLMGIGKEAPKEDDGPFKYITNRQEYKKGGFISNASPELQAQVKLQAMKLAAEAGDLRDASLMLQSANPTYAQIKDFYGQMNAAEQDAIKTYEKAVWASGGWKPEVIADQSVPAPEGYAAPPTGVPFPAPNNAGPSPDPMAPVPGIPNTPSPAAGLASTPPDVRSAMAAAMREGKSKEEIRAIYEQGRKAADMAGSVTTKPAAEKPLSMEERSRDFLIKNRLSKLAPQEAMQVLAMPSSPKAIREYLVFKGFKEGNALNETVNEIMRHINTFKTKTPK